MAEQAHITSFGALESFRTHLIVFLSKAHSRLDEVGDEIRRTRGWLQNDRRIHWESEIRRRRRALDQAEQELITAKLSSFRDNLAMEMMAVRRARQAFDEAGEKLQNVKRWTRDYEFILSPLAKKLESLRGVLDHELPQAVSSLLQAQLILESYAGIRAPGPTGGLPEMPTEDAAGQRSIPHPEP